MESECAHACLLTLASSAKTPDPSAKPILTASIKAGSPVAAALLVCRAPNAARMDGIARRRVRRAIAVSLSLPDGSVWSDNSTRCKVTSVHCVSHILGLSPAHAVRDVAADLTQIACENVDHRPHPWKQSAVFRPISECRSNNCHGFYRRFGLNPYQGSKYFVRTVRLLDQFPLKAAGKVELSPGRLWTHDVIVPI